jgi:hypothetical protein
MRVEIMKNFVRETFPQTPLLDYALQVGVPLLASRHMPPLANAFVCGWAGALAGQVEAITTAKKPNLILNVDGVIAVAFVDLLRECVCIFLSPISLSLSHTSPISLPTPYGLSLIFRGQRGVGTDGDRAPSHARRLWSMWSWVA